MKNFAQNLKKDPHSTTTAGAAGTAAPANPVAIPIQIQKNMQKEKKKIGRPKIKEGEYKTINISVPVSILEQMEVAKLKYGNNLTAYVNAVIKADLTANYDKYVELQKILNS